MNITHFTPLISSMLIILIYTTSNAKDLNLQEIEQALDLKTKTSSPPPCSIEIDSLLNELIDESTKEYTSFKLDDNQQAIDSSQDNPLVRMSKAELIILNKITAKSTQAIFNLSEKKFFGNISIEVHQCIKSTDPFNNNNFMLLTIFDNKIDDDNLSVFHGWVLSSNPSLSTLEHAVYEVLPIKCLPTEAK